MNTLKDAPSNLLPTNIGIQAVSPIEGVFQTGSFHQKAVNEFFGIDGNNLDDVRQVENQLTCFGTHEDMLRALGEKTVRTVMIAVDNNNSGRVNSAIEALRGRTEEMKDGRYKIIGKIAIAVDQHLLLPEGMEEADVEQVISQRPALKQVDGEIAAKKWQTVEYHDTVASAVYVKETAGNIPDSTGTIRQTAAIASELAGISLGLTVGRKLSTEGNATTFWLISNEAEKYVDVLKEPTHAAFTFSVPDTEGGLLTIVSRLSDAGFDLTDIDCHLASPDAKRSFFTEVKLSDQATPGELETILEELKVEYEIDLLGMYEDRTNPDVHTAMTRTQKTDLASIHTLWNGRDGHEIMENSPVVYIEATNEIGSLKGMLTAFHENCINILDMSRPYAPTGNGSRGFYFVLAPETPTEEVLQQLSDSGYKTQLCVHDGNDLQTA